MTKKIFASAVLVLISSALANAQTPAAPMLLPPQPIAAGNNLPPPPPPFQPAPVTQGSGPGQGTLVEQNLTQPFVPLQTNNPEFVDDRRGAWVTLDYLLWWVKPGPLPSPIVTTGSANDSIPGALGQPNTTILFGGRNMDFGTLSGTRLNAGWWLPCCPLFAIEGGFFVLEQGNVRFSALSDANGSPVLARPFIDTQTGLESAYIDSIPGVASGGVSVRSTTQLDAWEINLAANLLQHGNYEWDFLVGFRALDLVEDLQIADVFVPFAAGNFSFQGGPADPPNTLADYDHFHTANHFYGGQIGSRFNWSRGPLDISCTGKVALGTTQQTITVDGGSLLIPPGAGAVSAPGGVLAQQTNIGRYYRSEFSVVPEAGFNFGWQITPWARIQLGYSVLYWTNVVRPGNQIDRTVNPTQVPTDGSYGTLTGPARPVLLPQSSDFWTQGINFGIEFRF